MPLIERLNPIHEGSNGIQCIDLLGRKAMMDHGAALQAMLAELPLVEHHAQLLQSLDDTTLAMKPDYF